MQTEDLISVLASDADSPVPSFTRRFAWIVAGGFVISASLFWITLGLRPDFAAALKTPRFLLKFVEMFLIAGAALALVIKLARPGAHKRWAAIATFSALSLLILAAFIELSILPRNQWIASLVGHNAEICLTAIPLLSLPLLTAILMALRDGAPTHPAFTGTVAGLLAGALAATLYAAQCNDDSPLFVTVWYSIAIAVVALLGTVLGARILRW